MRRLTLGAMVLLLIVGCSTDEEPQATPQEVVAEWLAALDGVVDPSDFVMAKQLALLAAIGRPGLTADDMADGLSEATAAAYWESFSAGIESVAGARPSQLRVGNVTVLAVDGVDYAFVEVAGIDGTTVVVVRGTEDGLIDMVATVGPRLVRPLASVVFGVGLDAIDGPAIASSLRAGLSVPNLDLPTEFYGEVQDLIILLEG